MMQLSLSAEELKEVTSAIEHANNGNWLPLGLIALAGTIILALLIYIYKRDRKDSTDKQKENKDRLNRHKETIDKLDKLTEQNQSLIHRHDMEIQRLRDRA